MARREKSSYMIKSVVNALDLLEELSSEGRELGVTELSRRLNLHKNNVFRLLATLESRGYVEQNKETENYRLGLKSLELGQNYLRQMSLIKQVRPILEELVSRCNENAGLGVVRQQWVVYLDVVEAKRMVRVACRAGWRLPVYASAIGKVQLAFKSESEIEKSVNWDEMRAFTPNTITGREAFLKHLEEVRERGYAVDNEEYEEGVKCVAVPVRDYTRRVVAGISVQAPVFRLPPERIEEEIVPILKEAGVKASQRLGYGG